MPIVIKRGILPPLEIALLHQLHPLGRDMRLPRRRAHIPRSMRIRKQLLHLLERLPRRLREHKEDMHEHGHTKHAEEDIRLPLNILKRRRHEVAKREVEGPIPRRRERDGFPAHAQRVEFGGVDPRYGAPGGRVGGDEEVAAGDEALGGGAGDGPRCFGGFAADAAGTGVVPVGFENAGVGEEPGHHEGGADEEGGATAPAVDVEEGGDGHDDVDDVLDGGGEEEVVLREAGHGEDEGDVIHWDILLGLHYREADGVLGRTHDVHAGQLRPDLCEEADVCSIDHVWLEKLKIGDIGVVALELAHILDFLHFTHNKRAVWVAFAVHKGKHSVSLIPAIFAGKPTRRFREEYHSDEETDGGDHLEPLASAC